VAFATFKACYNIFMKKTSSGFTIVELLIVIVVIGILATITIVAYNGIQQRGRDAQRAQDIKSIAKALEIYKVQTGDYPVAVGSTGQGGWEMSVPTGSNTDFLSVLRTSGVISKVPIDPVNTGDFSTSGSKFYAYYRYPAGNASCDANRGPYYILLARTGESGSSSGIPTFTCGTYGSAGWISTGSFTN
jgi:type II secretion system protein G